MRRSAPCNPRAVHICRYVIKYFPTIWYLYCGHCCICIQSRYMHISPVSKLTSPLPPAHRVSIGQTNSSDFFFFSFHYLINSRNTLVSTVSRFSIHRKYSVKYYWHDGKRLHRFPISLII